MIDIDRPFRLLAHRGASAYAAENSFAAFDLAIEMQAEALETDLRLTRDGVIVCFHDPTVTRMTGGPENVTDLTWAEVSVLALTGGNGCAIEPQRVPRLEAFLDRYLRKILLCLEVKAIEVVAPLCDVLRDRGVGDDSVEWMQFTSFELDVTERLRDAWPMVRVGLLVRQFDSGLIAEVARRGFAEICPKAGDVTPDLVSEAHAAGLGVRAWGVHTMDELRRVYDSGVDGTTCNWPDWVRRSGGRVSVPVSSAHPTIRRFAAKADAEIDLPH